MNDSDKSKDQLIKELETLRRQLQDDSSKDAEAPVRTEGDQPSGGVSRREIVLSAWVSPVILSLPILPGSGVVSGTAHAQPPTITTTTTTTTTTMEPTSASPTTARPTTARPTTASPTTASPTTAEPTTMAPTTASPTTAAPTPRPTAFPTAAPTTVIPVELDRFNIE